MNRYRASLGASLGLLVLFILTGCGGIIDSGGTPSTNANEALSKRQQTGRSQLADDAAKARQAAAGKANSDPALAKSNNFGSGNGTYGRADYANLSKSNALTHSDSLAGKNDLGGNSTNYNSSSSGFSLKDGVGLVGVGALMTSLMGNLDLGNIFPKAPKKSEKPTATASAADKKDALLKEPAPPEKVAFEFKPTSVAPKPDSVSDSGRSSGSEITGPQQQAVLEKPLSSPVQCETNQPSSDQLGDLKKLVSSGAEKLGLSGKL